MSLCNHNKDETLDFLGLLQRITGLGVLTSFALILTSQTWPETGETSEDLVPASCLMCTLSIGLNIEIPLNSLTSVIANSIRFDSM